MQQDMSLIHDSEQEYLRIPLPGAEGVMAKVLKVDEERDRVVVKIRFAPGSSLPRHNHYCRAVAYTISGEWAYDEGSFGPGDSAFELEGNEHTPWSDRGAELFIVFDGKDGRYLDNYLEDGTVIKLDLPYFKAMEGLTQAEADQVDLLDLVEIVPAAA
ncbi:MAG: cupin domain-containing protein [Pseudomonadota bacterium]